LLPFKPPNFPKKEIMSEFKLMTTIEAYYKPQGDQSYRCSDIFPDWDTPETGTLKFKVTVPENYPQPIFAISHDKSGSDTRWYSNLSDGVQIDIHSEEGESGGYSLYIGTTSELPDSFDGSKKYKVEVYVLEGEVQLNPPGYRRMTSVVANYSPQDDQGYRCSNDFADWNTPEKGTIKFEVAVPDGAPQPTFSISHNKGGGDTRWYSGLVNQVEIDILSEEGESGSFALYVGTTSSVPDEYKDKQYMVTVYVWEGNTLPEMPLDDDKKIELIKKYAPYIYMAEEEEFFPSTVEFSFPHMTRFLKDDKYWVKTKEELKEPSDVLDYFHGDLENAKVYAFWVWKSKGVKEITYFIYYPYNRGKEVGGTIFGNHVGDWEHITVRMVPKVISGEWDFTPIKIHLSAHDGGHTKDWVQVDKHDGAPIVFSAAGSHAMYFEPGDHEYSKVASLVDKCSKGKVLNCVEDGRIVPFDFRTEKGLEGNDWPKWMSDKFEEGGDHPEDPASGPIYRWGNEEEGCEGVKINTPVGTPRSCRLEYGPTGPISKEDVWDENTFE
jgi:hypothetical protein